MSCLRGPSFLCPGIPCPWLWPQRHLRAHFRSKSSLNLGQPSLSSLLFGHQNLPYCLDAPPAEIPFSINCRFMVVGYSPPQELPPPSLHFTQRPPLHCSAPELASPRRCLWHQSLLHQVTLWALFPPTAWPNFEKLAVGSTFARPPKPIQIGRSQFLDSE